MGSVPSIPTDPTRKLEVIGVGFSRTGTVSYARAYEQLLDGPAFHAGDLLQREDSYCRKWNQIYQYRREDDKPRLMKALREATAGFVAMTDVPAFNFLPELMELYPDAKVVLVKRDSERWWKSFKPVVDNCDDPMLNLLVQPLPGKRWYINTARGYFEDVERRHGGRPGPDLILKHNAWVRSIVPTEKLLEVNIADGWEPLCKFLGKPIPSVPFPRENDAASREKLVGGIIRQGIMAWLGILAITGSALYGFWKFWNMS